MKNKKIKPIAVLLLLIFVVQVFVACNNTDGNNTINNSDSDSNLSREENNIDSDTEPIIENNEKLGFSVSAVQENIPADLNFNGRDFVILVGDPNEQVWTYTNMVVDEETGDTIDDAYYKRNRIVEDKLNINIKQVITALGSDQSRFRRAVESGDNSFDIAMIRYNGAANLATSNYCMALNDVPYLDFEKPWWDKGSLRDLSIAKRNYMMASDISIGDNDNTWLIFFDKQHIIDLGLDVPYTLVENGQWTFDKMLEMMKAAEIDLDGDGRMTVNDQFGFLTHGENYAGMWIAANQTLIEKDNDDMPYVAFNNETFISVWEKIIEIMNDTSCKADDIPFISSGFRDGKTLFGTEILKFVRDYRENEREFGIIPIPKFNEAQTAHHTYVAVSAPLLIIPKSNPDLENTGIIVEAMAAEGHRTIMPAYYETAIEGKFVRDVESIAMLDIAFATRKYDLGVVFNWGSMNSDLSGNLGPRRNADIASMIDRRGDSIRNAIDRTFEAFEAE